MIRVNKKDEDGRLVSVLVPEADNLNLLGKFHSYDLGGRFEFYLTLGYIGDDQITFDERDWDAFVNFVKEIDVFMKERNDG